MSLISDIASFVTTDVLKRSDLTTEAQNAALDFYKVLCYNVPFDELMTTSPAVPTVIGQVEYDLTSLVPALKSIANIKIQFSTNQSRRLRRSHIRVYDSLSFSTNSRPATYARWGLKINLNPPPDSASYNLFFRYWAKPTFSPGGVVGNTVIATPDEWDELIRYETLYRIYKYIGQEAKAAALIAMPFNIQGRTPSVGRERMMSIGIIPRLWNELLTTISQKENVDEDFSINPVVRNYTYGGR